MLPASTSALAKVLGFTSPTIGNWRRQYPDAPASLDPVAWRAFIATHGLGTRGNFQAASKQVLAERKLLAESRLLELKFRKISREVIAGNDVDSFLLFLASRLKSSLYQTFATELPPKTAGLDVAETRRLNREGCDVLMLSMQSLQDDWQAEQARARAAAAEADAIAAPDPEDDE